MNKSTLFQKTLIGQIILFGLIALSTSAFSMWNIRRRLMDEKLSQGKAIASSIVYSSEFLINASPVETTQAVIDEFLNFDVVAYIFVNDIHGNIIAHTFHPYVPESLPKLINNNSKPSIQEFKVTDRGTFIDISNPILTGIAGSVHVGIDKGRIINQIQWAIFQQVLFIFSLFLLSAVGTYLLIKRVSQPLNKITAYAERLANHDFDATIEIESPDEIGLLARTMQSMAGELSSFIKKLTIAVNDANEANYKLKKTQAQVVHNEKMTSLGQMVAGIAHEINNPVSFIHGNIPHLKTYCHDLIMLLSLYQQHYPEPSPLIIEKTEAIELDFLMEDLEKILKSCQIGSERIQQILMSLRTFSRLGEADQKAIDLHDCIDSTLLLLRHRLKAKNCRSEIQVIKEYGDLPMVECYPSQLNQVFMNLLSNAIDALEDEVQAGKRQDKTEIPTIKISTQITNEQVVIRIQDDGPGISTKNYSKLFDPFFTTKPIGKGTGLGLAISHQIITERHKGQLTFTSDLKQGTEFQIVLPLGAGT